MSNSRARRRHIKALTRRADHLRERLADSCNADWRGRDYDVAELSALKEAIAVLTAHYAEMVERVDIGRVSSE